MEQLDLTDDSALLVLITGLEKGNSPVPLVPTITQQQKVEEPYKEGKYNNPVLFTSTWVSWEKASGTGAFRALVCLRLAFRALIISPVPFIVVRS